MLELLKLSEKQLAGIRHVLDAAGKNPKVPGAELFTLSQRLDELRARFSTAAAVVVQVTFRRASTAFNPDAQEWGPGTNVLKVTVGDKIWLNHAGFVR